MRRRKRREFTTEFKLQMVTLYQNGKLDGLHFSRHKR
jgi:transposase-like protein